MIQTSDVELSRPSTAFRPYHDHNHDHDHDTATFSSEDSSVTSSPQVSPRRPKDQGGSSSDEDSDSTIPGPSAQRHQPQHTMHDLNVDRSNAVASPSLMSSRLPQEQITTSPKAMRTPVAMVFPDNNEDLLRHSAALGLELAHKVETLEAEVVDLRATNNALESRLHETRSRLHAERKHSMHTLLKTERELCELRNQEEQWIAIHDGIRERTIAAANAKRIAQPNRENIVPNLARVDSSSSNSNYNSVEVYASPRNSAQMPRCQEDDEPHTPTTRARRGSQEFNNNSPLVVARRAAEKERQQELQLKHIELTKQHQTLQNAVLNLTGKLHVSRAQCKEQQADLLAVRDALAIERETSSKLQTINTAVEEEVRELRSYVREGSVLGGKIDGEDLLKAQQGSDASSAGEGNTLQDELEQGDLRDKLARTAFQLECALEANVSMKCEIGQLVERNAMANGDLESMMLMKMMMQQPVQGDVAACSDSEARFEENGHTASTPSSPQTYAVSPSSPSTPVHQQQQAAPPRSTSPPRTPLSKDMRRSETPLTPLPLPPPLAIGARPPSRLSRPLALVGARRMNPLAFPGASRGATQQQLPQVITTSVATQTTPTKRCCDAPDCGGDGLDLITGDEASPPMKPQLQASGEAQENQRMCSSPDAIAATSTTSCNARSHLQRIRTCMWQSLRSSEDSSNEANSSSSSSSPSSSLLTASDFDDLAHCMSDVVSVLASLLANVAEQCSGHDHERQEEHTATVEQDANCPRCPVSGWVPNLSSGLAAAATVDGDSQLRGALPALVQRINAHILATKTASTEHIRSTRQRKRILVNCDRQASESLAVIERLENWKDCLNFQTETQHREELAQAWVKTQPEIASQFAADVVRAFSRHMSVV